MFQTMKVLSLAADDNERPDVDPSDKEEDVEAGQEVPGLVDQLPGFSWRER